MKKLIAALMSLVLVLGLAACVAEPNDIENVGGETTASVFTSGSDRQAIADPDAPVNDTAGDATVITAADGFENAGFTCFECDKTGTYTFTASGSEDVTWDVYLFDAEFEDANRYIPQASTPVLTGSGDVGIAQGQFIYIQCSSNAFTADEADANAQYAFAFTSDEYNAPAQNTAAPAQYDSVINAYVDAMAAQTEVGDLMDTDVCYLVGMHYEDPGVQYGWVARDIDGDGTAELIVGTTAPGNDFMDNLVLGLYRMGGTGKAEPVFISGERDRWYYVEGNTFAHEGSGSAFDSFAQNETYTDGTMTITGEESTEFSNPGYILFGEGADADEAE